MAKGISIDVVASGDIRCMYKLPNGKLRNFVDKDGNAYDVWKSCEKPRSFKMNVLQIEYYQKQTYPIVEVEIRRKDVSKLYEWWIGDWDPLKIWDVNIRKKGEKTVVMVKIGDQIMYLDNDVSEIESALNSVCPEWRK
jgi:hypothetical protein